MSDDAPANVSFKSDLTLVKGSVHAEAVFERAHARFNACSPALATPKPALFLSRCPAGAEAAAGRQNQQAIERIEDRIGDRGCFLKEGESKQRGWPNDLTDPVPNRYTRLGTWTAIIKINFFFINYSSALRRPRPLGQNHFATGSS
jgi:hypothetical protein